jgi:restriction endonuclease Mrr
MDGEKLVKLLVENEIGVTSSTLRLVQIDETDETASAERVIQQGTEK